ncbi:MFS transporter [Paenibacillus sp. BT-177]|uniref:MFS transporter n=1 Tax=Paenibacillus sp. BT-177 TaxID=2986930 RepID=UPI0021F7EF54|nr:MFS transporter [Paenibacillus sp. BT-177]
MLAQDMLGIDSFSGVPTGLFTLGSAGAALMVGRLSQRLGRRTGLAAGFLTGDFGAIGVVLAALINSIPLLFISMLVYGAGTATNLQARYAGTDLALPTQRAKTMSMAMVFTTFGTVADPNLVELTGKLAISLGAPALKGPFILASIAYILAGVILLVFLKPGPLIVAKAKEQAVAIQMKKEPVFKKRNYDRCLSYGANTNCYIAIMTMAPVHMQHHGHDLSEIGLVIGIHVASMYLQSVITGVLVDKFGYIFMAYASGFTLMLSGLLAAFVLVIRWVYLLLRWLLWDEVGTLV